MTHHARSHTTTAAWTLLLALTLLALSGCDTAATATPMPAMPPTATPLPLPAGSSVPAHIRARGYLVVGMRYDLPPFGYVTDEGTVAGFDVDLGRELARRWLGDPQAVQFRQVRSDTAVDHILAGDVDLVPTALLHTQPVEEQVDLGLPLFVDGQALLVHASDALSITAPADLEGRAVGVVTGAEAEDALWAAVTFTPTIYFYDTFDAAADALARGEVSAVADLRRRLVRGLRDVPGTVIVGQYSSAFLAPAYAPNEPGLADLVALTEQDMFADGTFYDIYYRWFPGDTAPNPEIWPGVATLTLDEAAEATRAPDTIASIQYRRRLRVALIPNRNPFAYLDADGAAAGYEVHLLRLMAERWLGDSTAIDFMPVTEQEGLRMLGSGEADVLIGALRHTREAELEADFSLTTYVAGESLMVLAGAAPDGMDGLEGQMVAAVNGTGGGEALLRAADAAQVRLTIVGLPSLEDAMAALEAGEVYAVVGERADLLGPSYATPGVGVTADRFSRVPLALGLPPGDSAFRDLVNLTLQAMNWEGQFGLVYNDWFDDDPPPMPPWPGEPGQLTINN